MHIIMTVNTTMAIFMMDSITDMLFAMYFIDNFLPGINEKFRLKSKNYQFFKSVIFTLELFKFLGYFLKQSGSSG